MRRSMGNVMQFYNRWKRIQETARAIDGFMARGAERGERAAREWRLVVAIQPLCWTLCALPSESAEAAVAAGDSVGSLSLQRGHVYRESAHCPANCRRDDQRRGQLGEQHRCGVCTGVSSVFRSASSVCQYSEGLRRTGWARFRVSSLERVSRLKK